MDGSGCARADLGGAKAVLAILERCTEFVKVMFRSRWGDSRWGKTIPHVALQARNPGP